MLGSMLASSSDLEAELIFQHLCVVCVVTAVVVHLTMVNPFIKSFMLISQNTLIIL